tara:strand:- start:94 stop:504 length:411 start_codon:yes stop_codon:yes gene_type:complete
MIIADPGMDRNLGYAGKKGLPRKAVRPVPAQRTHPQGQFLQEIEGCVGPGFSISAHQGILWAKRSEEHRPGGFFQALSGGLSGEHHQRPPSHRALFNAVGHPIFHRLQYRRGAAVAQYDKQDTPTLSAIGFRRGLR